MRLDYNEPKKSYGTPIPAPSRSRRESSSGSVMLAVVVTGIISLSVGFASGWFLSQKHAKKGFKAAMEQQSLENASKPVTPVPPAQQAAPQTAATAPSTQTGTTAQQPPPPGTTTPPETPLSFYKTLPSGQKSNVLGSGINTAIDGNAPKQPLQAAIPSNLQKQPQTQPQPQPTNSGKTSTPAAGEKPTTRHDTAGGYTVQVASLSLKSEADTLKSRLISKGYSVHIVESNLGDKGTWYRVRVGRKLDQEAAKELATKLGRGSMPIPDRE